jgi:hypothetical protein
MYFHEKKLHSVIKTLDNSLNIFKLIAQLFVVYCKRMELHEYQIYFIRMNSYIMRFFFLLHFKREAAYVHR